MFAKAKSNKFANGKLARAAQVIRLAPRLLTTVGSPIAKGATLRRPFFSLHKFVDDGNFAYGEYFRTLRLKSELFDLRVENVNPIRTQTLCEQTAVLM